VPIDRAATLRQAETLLRQGKLDQAIAEYVRLVDDQPRDWNTANALGDLLVRAGHLDRAIEQFSRIAASLVEQGFLPRASAVYKKILKLKPDADHALVQAGELAAQQGLLADARAFFAGTCQARRARGDTKGALEILIRVGSLDRSDVAARLAAGRARLELDDLPGALQEFNDLAAWQIAEGREADAVVPLSEVASLDPGNSHVRRELARILLAQGRSTEAAKYLTTDDVGADAGPLIAAQGSERGEERVPEPADLHATPQVPPGPSTNVEEDLSVVLDEFNAAGPQIPSAEAPAAAPDIESVFAEFRDEAEHRAADDPADIAYTRGVALIEAGDLESSIEPLRSAARSPGRRFAAASLLSRVYQQQNAIAEAIEWLGHAADAPTTSAQERFETLFRMGELLEISGEPESALAVFLELQANAGEYRDITGRIARLSGAQGGG
jgi:tetratricopeptide (TPR) repeat protein